MSEYEVKYTKQKQQMIGDVLPNPILMVMFKNIYLLMSITIKRLKRNV